MQLTLAQVVAATGASFDGSPALLERTVTGWSIDSRTVVPGDLFFAIYGESQDGHAYVEAALAAGAVAAVVSQFTSAAPVLSVPDVLAALQAVAHFARRDWRGRIVAVTGSAGKTSTKDVIASLLAVQFRTGKTVGNYNNHLGLPLSILRLPGDAEVAVLEIGMNHAGEIRSLARLARPDVGVVTNVGYAHVENFVNIDGIAAAKRELVDELGPDGLAVLNADDDRVLRFRNSHPGRVMTYGLNEAADVHPTHLVENSEGASFRVRDVPFHTSLAGRHGLRNILAGLVVAIAFEVPLERLTRPVAELAPGKMRGERIVRNGITVLNDSYNSNPEAVASMLAVLRNENAKRRVAVLGEMRELGAWSEQLHRAMGTAAASAGVDVLVAIRGDARFASDAARAAGMPDSRTFFFEDPESAGDFLRAFVRAGDAILFKGSRGTHVEHALARMEA